MSNFAAMSMLSGRHDGTGSLVTPEMRDKAYQQTQAHLQKLNAIRSEAGLPVEQMDLVAAIYQFSLHAQLEVVVEEKRKRRAVKQKAARAKMLEAQKANLSAEFYGGSMVGGLDQLDVDDDDDDNAGTVGAGG